MAYPDQPFLFDTLVHGKEKDIQVNLSYNRLK